MTTSALTGETTTPLLVLDIDGTVRQGKDDALGRWVNGPEDVVVFPAARQRMAEWKASGGRIIGLSNQGGVGLGIVTAEAVMAGMAETQHQCGNLFDKIVMCFHHPDAEDLELARCWCRKPSPGGLVEGALEMAGRYDEIYPPHMGLFVGDLPVDEECARLAGFPFSWALEWREGAVHDG